MEMDEKTSEQGQKWVTLRAFRFEAEAAVLAAMLEAAQIPVFISDSFIASTIPMAGDTVRVQVPEAALTHAQAILYDFDLDRVKNKETNFKEATKDDIAYQKALNEGSQKPEHWVMAFLIGIIIILLLRAAGKTAGILPNIF